MAIDKDMPETDRNTEEEKALAKVKIPKESEEHVLQEIQTELHEVRSDQKQMLKVTRTIQHEGPLPPPELLAGYEAVLTGGANRIFEMAENDLKHTHWIQKLTSIIDAVSTIGGLLAGFAIAIYGIKTGADLISGNKSVEGSIIGTVSIVGLVWVFVKGKAAEFPFTSNNNNTEE